MLRNHLKRRMKKIFNIDEITWNDLSMDQVLERLDYTNSSVGKEYLKRELKTLQVDPEFLKKRSKRAEFFHQNVQFREKIIKIYKGLGKSKKLSLYDYLFRFHEVEQKGIGIHYLLIVLLLFAIALIFIRPEFGILALTVMFVINILTYFKFKARVESYFMCFKYIVHMMNAAGKIQKAAAKSQIFENSLTDVLEKLYAASKELAPLKRASWLLTNSVSGSLIDVFMDYIRMLFHVDILRFYAMRKIAAEKTEAIDNLFCALGELELAVSLSLYRESLDQYCIPEFTDSRIVIRGIYHPLTENSVANDITVEKSILLTGSNASGKSTFLKQIAINQIFAQTICTCLAEAFQTRCFKVLSSMALSDNILANESYFIVEIKSLKRIFDAVSDETLQMPVMCFIDEVLRGTNTKERIAASSEILRSLASKDTVCFAATHDIELTHLLADKMENYHFEETVSENEVSFDYKLKAGPTTSRNAIRLLRMYGFDPAITDRADQLVDRL